MLATHPDIQIRAQVIGAERAPLLVIDNVVADPERLVRKATRYGFSKQGAMFPGVRAQAPFSYRDFLETTLQPLLQPYFGLPMGRFEFPMCHYSLVTTTPGQLKFLQKVPHIDSTDGSGLATVHYLFDGWGGTAFYRHRQTGFEFIDEQRGRQYFHCLEQQSHLPDATGEDVLAAIRRDSTLKKVPVAVVTSRVLSPEERTRLGERAQAVLEKSELSAATTREILARAGL